MCYMSQKKMLQAIIVVHTNMPAFEVMLQCFYCVLVGCPSSGDLRKKQECLKIDTAVLKNMIHVDSYLTDCCWSKTFSHCCPEETDSLH